MGLLLMKMRTHDLVCGKMMSSKGINYIELQVSLGCGKVSTGVELRKTIQAGRYRNGSIQSKSGR